MAGCWVSSIPTVSLGMLVALSPQSATSQSTEYQLGQIVVARDAFMFDLQSSYWTLLAIKNRESDDFQGAADAARQIEGFMAGFVPLMQPGTARGQAPGSRATPEVWTEAEAFAAAADGFRSKRYADPLLPLLI